MTTTTAEIRIALEIATRGSGHRPSAQPDAIGQMVRAHIPHGLRTRIHDGVVVAIARGEHGDDAVLIALDGGVEPVPASTIGLHSHDAGAIARLLAERC